MEEIKFKDGTDVKVLSVRGFSDTLRALRAPYNLKPRSEIYIDYDIFPNNEFFNIEQVFTNEDDLKLLKKLILAGNEHCKCLRGTQASFEITMPRYWWQEFDTYTVGVTKLGSYSSMHIDCKGLKDQELIDFKDNQPEGNLNTRYVQISYPALRNIYFQRRNHRLPHWKLFCKKIEELPYSELITLEKQK